jgi:hypothetical protein
LTGGRKTWELIPWYTYLIQIAGTQNAFLSNQIKKTMGIAVFTHGVEGEGYIRDRRSQRAARARGEDPGELLLYRLRLSGHSFATQAAFRMA